MPVIIPPKAIAVEDSGKWIPEVVSIPLPVIIPPKVDLATGQIDDQIDRSVSIPLPVIIPPKVPGQMKRDGNLITHRLNPVAGHYSP